MERRYLTVCLHLISPNHFDIPLRQIIEGHVFGPYQPLKLVLHGTNGDEIEDIASDIRDCCCPLIEDICTTSGSDYDIIVVFLPNNHQVFDWRDEKLASANIKYDSMKLMARSALDIANRIEKSINDSTYLLVLGEESNIMASLLSHQLGGRSGNKLLAFQPESTEKSRSNGPYNMADVLTKTVSNWWAGIKVQNHKKLPFDMKAGIKFFGGVDANRNVQNGVFLSVPVEVIGTAAFRVCPGLNLNFDNETISSTFKRTRKAFEEMNVLTNESCEIKENIVSPVSLL